MWELRGLAEVNDELQRRQGRLLAISVDSPKQSLAVVREQHLEFSILSDGDGEVIRDYGILHQGGGPHNTDVAVPAMFLIDRNGKLIWSHKAKRITDRANPRDVLEVIQAL